MSRTIEVHMPWNSFETLEHCSDRENR